MFQREDAQPTEIDFPPPKSEPGRMGKGVVVVVPSLAKRPDRHEPVIAAGVSRDKAPLAPKMADGVDAEDKLMHQENANGTAPEQALQRACPSPRDRTTQDGGHEEGEEHPENVQSVNALDHRVAVEVGDVGKGSRPINAKQPTHVGVPKSLQLSPKPRPVQIRGMEVSGVIGEEMVCPVVADPTRDRALGCHTASNC